MRLRAALIICVFALAACGKKEKPAPAADDLFPASDTAASGAFINAKGETVGSVAFKESAGGVLLRLRVSGLSPGWHAVHLHQTGDCADRSDGFKRSGGHINHDQLQHGLINAAGSETGDLPNVFAGKDGVATAELFRPSVALRPSEEKAAELGPFPLLDDDGFAVVVHEAADDQSTQPIGGAGGRVACAAVTG
jgi:Cu-Zn family superoxide dismutase